MREGIYEELVTQLVNQQLGEMDREKFYVNKVSIDKAEASSILSRHLAETIKIALGLVTGDNQIEKQIQIRNSILYKK